MKKKNESISQNTSSSDKYNTGNFNDYLQDVPEEPEVHIRKFSPLLRKIIIWIVLSSIFLVIFVFILFGVL